MALLSLIAKLGLDKSGFDAGLNQATRQVSQFGSNLKSQLAGAFGTAALVAFAKSSLEWAASIHEVSQRLGITTDQAQQFALAAKTSGQDVDVFARAMEKLSIEQRKAIAGGNAGAFERFGLTVADLRELDPVDLFERMAASVEGVGITSQKAAAFFEIFGTQSGLGGRVLKLARDLEAAKENAILVSPDGLKRAKEFDDAIASMVQNLKAATVEQLNFLTTAESFKLPRWWKATGFGRLLPDNFFRQPESDAQAGEIEAESGAEFQRGILARQEREAQLREDILEIQQKVTAEEKKNEFAALDTRAKRINLLDQEVELMQQINALMAQGNQLEAEAARLAATQIRGKIEELERAIEREKSPVEKEKKSAALVLGGNALNRVGAFTGGGNPFDRGFDKLDRKLTDVIRVLQFNGVVIRDIR